MIARCENGLSVVQLLISIAVVAILTTIAIPNIEQARELYRIEATASTIQTQLADARINAIKRNREVWLEIDFTDEIARVETDDPNAPGTDLELGTPSLIPSKLNFPGTNTSVPSRVTFDPLGKPLVPFQLTLEGPETGNQTTVTVSASGRIKIT